MVISFFFSAVLEIAQSKEPFHAATIQLYKEIEQNELSGSFSISALTNKNNVHSLVGKINGELTWASTDLGGSAIVAKSLYNQGYIKYVNGLIIQWGNSSIPYTNFTIKDSEKILSGYIMITFPINFTNSCKYVGNNRTYIHTNYGWEGGGMAAHSITTNSFNSYAWIPPNIVFIEETTNLDGVGASYLSIGY